MKKIILGILALITLLFFLAYAGLRSLSSWYNTHEIIFNQMVKVELKVPVEIKKREPQIKEIVLDYPDEIDTPIEKYICEKFGPFDCKTALAVFSAESGLREDALNVNTNGSIDYGIAQINSGNWKLPGCSLKEIVDQYKNVDCGYKLWDRGDGKEGDGKGNFNAWVAFKNNNYMGKL